MKPLLEMIHLFIDSYCYNNVYKSVGDECHMYRKAEFALDQQETITCFEGSFIELTGITIGIPQPMVTWTLNGQEIEYNRRIGFQHINGSLIIRKIQMSDAGSYTCQAKNVLGQASRNVVLIVQELDKQQAPNITNAPMTRFRKRATLFHRSDNAEWIACDKKYKFVDLFVLIDISHNALNQFNDFKNLTYNLAINFDIRGPTSKSRFGVAFFGQEYKRIFSYRYSVDIHRELKNLRVVDRASHDSRGRNILIAQAIRKAVEGQFKNKKTSCNGEKSFLILMTSAPVCGDCHRDLISALNVAHSKNVQVVFVASSKIEQSSAIEDIKIFSKILYKHDNVRSALQPLLEMMHESVDQYCFHTLYAKPEIIRGQKETITMPVGSLVELTCMATGIPKPMITWTFKGQEISYDNGRIYFEDQNGSLIIRVSSNLENLEKPEQKLFLLQDKPELLHDNTTFSSKLFPDLVVDCMIAPKASNFNSTRRGGNFGFNILLLLYIVLHNFVLASHAGRRKFGVSSFVDTSKTNRCTPCAWGFIKIGVFSAPECDQDKYKFVDLFVILRTSSKLLDHFEKFKNLTFDLATNFDSGEQSAISRFGLATFGREYQQIFSFNENKNLRIVHEKLKELQPPKFSKIPNQNLVDAIIASVNGEFGINQDPNGGAKRFLIVMTDEVFCHDCVKNLSAILDAAHQKNVTIVLIAPQEIDQSAVSIDWTMLYMGNEIQSILEPLLSKMGKSIDDYCYEAFYGYLAQAWLAVDHRSLLNKTSMSITIH
uniref:Uncharacterized protein n=1 Tax=Romanomermis culicivorax TaxID=13658 RepID=A0A915JXU5_ROMCU